ncbi:MAG TPA: hypothetical protein VFJ14_00210 [Nocardioidaceae bacterium]|nr:hypothetical protein [Nocardioidaceae bacterium]
MSEPASGDVEEIPTHCPYCGNELEIAPAEMLSAPPKEEWDQGARAREWFFDKCPNPDCPAKTSA